ncbi:MAG: type II secretion system F family protein [Patescibacteria group bacterium]|nr:type II secretion system F family protein [Patescibacteria group bacterium]
MALSFFNRVSIKEKAFFARQLATMLESGLTLDKSLEIITTQTKNQYFQKALKAILQDMEEGSPFSVAIAKFPKIFDRIFINVVISGEAVGKITEALKRLADQIEAQDNFISKVRGAIMYPAFIVVAMIAVMVLMMVKVVPELKSVFAEAGAQLPWSTKVLLGISDSLTNFWWIYILAIIALIILFRFSLKTDWMQYVISKMEINFPGGIARDIYMTRFSQTLGMLLKAGTPIIEAINITGEVMNNKIYKEKLQNAALQVEKGIPLSSPIEKSTIFPLIVSQMILIGEQTGRMDTVLEKLAQYYENESDGKIKTLSSLLEPALMVLIGLAIGFLVFSIILPIYQLAQIQ